MKTRNTVQRSLVLEAVRTLQCHATADEVYNLIAQNHPNISRGTVYRNLVLLSELGEIYKVAIPNGADCYDHQCHKHYHAKCSKCGLVLDVDMEYMPKLENKINNQDDFEFTGHDVIFNGLCHKCKT